jgi:hemoglobin
MKKDIESEDDLRRLVDAFYTEVMSDELLAPHFAHTDFEHHKPKMVAFWAFVTLDQPGYSSNVFDNHAHLAISKPHFDRWVNLFTKTVQEMFEGARATEAINRAKVIGWTFSEKMKKQAD